MPERKQEVRVFQLGYACDKCGGSVEATGKHYTVDGKTLYAHACIKCGTPRNFPVVYPQTVQEVVEDEAEGEELGAFGDVDA